MIRRYCLLFLSVLFSYTMIAQNDSIKNQQEPILGYYHLGMDFDEYWSQLQKLKETTEIMDSTTLMAKYLISINGIAFNVENMGSPASDIGLLDYEGYSQGTLPLYFTGENYFLDGKLVSVTVNTPLPYTDGGFCYMPASLSAQKNLPKNQHLFDVNKVELHNQLVTISEELLQYLSKKYGTPTKEYQIAKLESLRKNELYRTFTPHWFSLCRSGAILPKAEWVSGNMKIIMGISSSATIFISFIDESALSHQHLDRLFKPTNQSKPTIEW